MQDEPKFRTVAVSSAVLAVPSNDTIGTPDKLPKGSGAFTFTRLTSHNCAMAKKMARNAAGRVVSEAMAQMTEGAAEVRTCGDLTEFAEFLETLTDHQAIACGIPLSDEDTKLTTRAREAFDPDGAIARTNVNFKYPDGAALVPVDIDVEEGVFADLPAVLNALEFCSPWLKGVHRFARPSSSSYVDGRGLRGVHVYFVVTRGTDTPAIAERMQIEQWLNGRGYVKISKSGALLTRQLSDALVYQPSRIMFVSPPVLGEGIARVLPLYPNKHGELKPYVEREPDHMGERGRPPKACVNGQLDVQELDPIKPIDRRRFLTAERHAKAARKKEAKQVALDYQRDHGTFGSDPEEAATRGLRAALILETGVIPLEWSLRFHDIADPVPVAAVIANRADALGRYCADPLDAYRDDLTEARLTKAFVVEKDGKLGVWSHKGRRFYPFATEAETGLATPLGRASVRLVGMVEYPESMGKAAPFVNIQHGLEALLRAIDAMPFKNVATGERELDHCPKVGHLVGALSRIGCPNVSPGAVEKALEVIADENERDPWRETCLDLPKWDGVPRLDTVFMDVCHAPPSEALMRAGQTLFAGLVMRQLRPGAPVPVVPVLIGPQGYGKGQFVAGIARALNMPPPSSVTFSGDPRSMSMKAGRSVVAELAEMSGMGKKDAEEIKQWITDDVDAYRAPYARKEEKHPRRFVLVGTANKHELNRDETGNRRFMPVDVPSPIDPNWSVEVPQLLAEAKARFCNEEADYFALIRRAADAVRDFNAAAVKRGVGTGDDELSGIVADVARGLVARPNSGGFARLADVVGDVNAKLRATYSPKAVARWLRARQWEGYTNNGTCFRPPADDDAATGDALPPAASNPGLAARFAANADPAPTVADQSGQPVPNPFATNA
jgi:hypothetical protein